MMTSTFSAILAQINSRTKSDDNRGLTDTSYPPAPNPQNLLWAGMVDELSRRVSVRWAGHELYSLNEGCICMRMRKFIVCWRGANILIDPENVIRSLNVVQTICIDTAEHVDTVYVGSAE